MVVRRRYTWAFLRPGQVSGQVRKSLNLNSQAQNPARPDLRAYKPDPNSARTYESPTQPELSLNPIFCKPEPDPTFQLQNQARTWPDMQARPGPAFSGRVGSGCPCPGVAGGKFSFFKQNLQVFLKSQKNMCSFLILRNLKNW
jgi:hypothetical protein